MIKGIGGIQLFLCNDVINIHLTVIIEQQYNVVGDIHILKHSSFA